MSNYALPVPPAPYPDWSRLLAAMWEHGRLNPDPALIEEHMGADLMRNLRGTFIRREGPAQVRPSSLISCARQEWLLRQGYEPEPMPDGIALTFSMGHLVEAAGRIYFRGSLPPGFALYLNTQVPLPGWWPPVNATAAHKTRFAEAGSNDFRLEVTNPKAAARYLDLERAAPRVIGDFKTASSYQYDKFATAKIRSTPDGFGYVSQVSIYAAGQPQPCDAVLLVFNRNSPSQPAVVRGVSQEVRDFEVARIRRGFEGAADPGRELYDRWATAKGGSAAHFYCNKARGYCPQRVACAAVEPPARAEAV